MNIIYLGDIMGAPGIEVVQKILPDLRREKNIDLVIAQSENVSEGKGMTLADMHRLQKIGVDFFTGGNHTPARVELTQLLEDNSQPVIGPANMSNCPGSGWKYVDTAHGKVLIISLLGLTVGREVEIANPLQFVDNVLKRNENVARIATIVNFHGDYSSEKKVIGYYLDGRVTAVIGDHWHIPTADAMVLPKGTAHITDVGMCGVLHSSLGVKTEIIALRWRKGVKNKNELETTGPLQFNAVLVEAKVNGLAQSIIPIQKILE